MRGNVNRTLKIILLIACIMSISLSTVSAPELEYRVDSSELTVYRDGLVHVTQVLTVNETFPSVSLRLLAPSIENIIAVDENDTFLDYEVGGSNMTIFTLGARRVLLEYDTASLTEKEAGVWTLILSAPYNVSVHLPEDSTIIYLNEMPDSISMEDGRISLSLSPGNWEISYVLSTVPFRVSDLIVNPTEVEAGKEITISARVTNIGEVEGSYTVILKINQTIENTETITLAGKTSTTVGFKVVKKDAGMYSVELAGLKGSFSVKPAPTTVSIPIEYATVAAIGAIAVGFLLLRRRAPSAEKILKKHIDLRQEDKEVIQFIAEKGGRVLESELRERFQEMPRTTLWRLVRRLEKMEIVSVKKVGLQNQIELRK